MIESGLELLSEEPYIYPGEGKNGAIGVVVCHGFTGAPYSMLPWARALARAGYAVSVPRLEGHGTQWQDMKTTRWQDWYASVERAYRDLAATREKVFVFGMSMGGTLSLRLASEYPVAGLALVNPGLVIPPRAAEYAHLLKFVVASMPAIGGNIKKPGVDENAYPRTAVAAVDQLRRLMANTRERLGKINAPLLLMRSRVDTVVSDISVESLLTGITSQQRAQTRIVWLEDSYHVATLDNDAPLIESESIHFLATHAHPEETREHA